MDAAAAVAGVVDVQLHHGAVGEGLQEDVPRAAIGVGVAELCRDHRPVAYVVVDVVVHEPWVRCCRILRHTGPVSFMTLIGAPRASREPERMSRTTMLRAAPPAALQEPASVVRTAGSLVLCLRASR
jgi:hypothetical protein